MPVEIFFSYAHEDEELMDQVRRQLIIFERTGKIRKWHDRMIPPGTEWEPAIDHRLRDAKIILLFVSPAFIESRYCYDIEVVAALERHARGDARVIPIILRPCAWDAAPFAALQALPKDAVPVSQWPDRDQVCLDVARAVMAVVDDLDAGKRRGARGARRSNVKSTVRRSLEGDRIPRIMVEFVPPKGTNVPRGYQPRLTQIAAQVVRDGAVRDDTGRFSFPAQFRGEASRLETFLAVIKSKGAVTEVGSEQAEGRGQIWFEYTGDLSPEQVAAIARENGLDVVHCGATLFGSPPPLTSSSQEGPQCPRCGRHTLGARSRYENVCGYCGHVTGIE